MIGASTLGSGYRRANVLKIGEIPMTGPSMHENDEQELLRRLEDLVARRALTDRLMGSAWMLIPVLPILLVIALVAGFVQAIMPMVPNLRGLQGSAASSSLLAQLVGVYALAIVSLYAALFLLSLALYYLIDRRNNHFKRQQLLFKTLVKYLETETKAKSAHPSTTRLAELCEDSMFDEQGRSAGIWTILNLFVTPMVSLIVAFNLTQDLCKHDLRQIDFQETLISALAEIGVTLPSSVNLKPLKRDTILLLLLTIITGGLFWIYWFHILLKDYNEHFANQALFEDKLLAALKPTQQVKKCGTCGGSIPENARFCPFCGKPQTS